MKLRNIFLAGLAVCTMASCSNDDEINQGPQQQVDAMVSFGITTDVITRATTDRGEQEGLENENFVKELTALIFDADGKLVGRKDTVQPDSKKDQSINKIEHVTIKVTPSNGSDGKSNEKFKAVLIANASTTVANVTKLSDLEDGTAALELKNYTKGMIDGSVRLPMASKTLEFKGVTPLGDNHTENWVYQEGYGIGVAVGSVKPSMLIPLYRLVARIDLEKVSIHKEAKGLDFILTRVFLANVASKSPVKYLTEEKNTLVETGNDFAGGLWKGFQSEFFGIKESNNLIIPGENTSGEIDGDKVNDKVVKSFLSKKWDDNYFTLDLMKSSIQFDGLKDENKPKPGHEDPFYFYIFAKPFAKDNHYDTRLVLEGLFRRTPTSKPELRHFHVVFNDTNGVNGVKANNIYKLTVYFTGEGSPNENEMLLNAHISAQIEVAKWNVIEQNEGDIN